ncbi:tannase/feruloyl esterase family alpha/beta hydrolase [Tateyamaria sp. SN6-1]|uniref:tannase/feruloyl esterase family alpha/beta hydrolase n=1 Tax=Tateyamaria sp. SN6-1 TaxID=3092148 RepID=UPI0039F55199
MRILTFVAAMSAGLWAVGAQAQMACEDLADLATGDVTFTAATISDGTVTPPGGDAITGLPPMCRVSMAVPEAINIELWLPLEGWNGRFRGVGGGGYSGAPSWGALAAVVRDGYAVASTDTGHMGHGGDGSFAFTDDGTLDWSLIEDFASRSLFETSRLGQEVTEAFYGRAPDYTYWSGCSTGGRQGLIQVQRTPYAYDGVLSGAPAIHWNQFIAAELWPQIVMREDAGGPLPACKFDLANAAAVAACDELDGAVDGLLQDPRECGFDPASLVCAEGAEPDCGCLTEGEASAISRIWAGAEGTDGRVIWPGLTPGTSHAVLANEGPFPIAVSQFQWVQADPQADWTTLTSESFEAYFQRSYAMFNDMIGTTDPDISEFADAGGHLILWHGWTDQFIFPEATINYYDQVVGALGDTADETVRLYMVPGVDHCRGGVGPSGFGHRDDDASGSVALQQDAQHDIFEALVAWVERNEEPGTLTGVRWTENDPTRGVALTHPICVWPQQAVYDGNGAINEASSYMCDVVD